MDSLAIFGYGEIRVTDDGRYSIYDLIEVVGGKKDPYNTWKRLCEEYAEVQTKCQDFQFPGRGQRSTPVADKNNVLYIIGLLPGTVGRSYREEAAELMIAEIKGKQHNIKPQAMHLPEQRAKYVFDFAREILSRSTRLSAELQDIYALRTVEAHLPDCAQMTKVIVGAIQEATATGDRHLTPSELGEIYQERHNLPKPVKASDINIALLNAGLQSKEVVVKLDKQAGKEKKINRWHLTEFGKEWGVVIQDKARGHDKTVEHVRWLPTVLDVIDFGGES